MIKITHNRKERLICSICSRGIIVPDGGVEVESGREQEPLRAHILKHNRETGHAGNVKRKFETHPQ